MSHSDADGIAGASIAKKALEERGIDYEIKFVKYINRKFLKKYRERENFTWFIDVGNGNIKEIKELQINCVISDHHFSNEEYDKSLNPFFYGIDGEAEISASGLAHIISSCLSTGDANIAIIGAIGDLQDMSGKLIGINREILLSSTIDIKRDLRIYGRDKPLYQMLAHSSSPFIPGLFKRYKNTIAFLKSLQIPHQKKWNELNEEEKRIVLSSIIKKLIEKGFGYNQ